MHHAKQRQPVDRLHTELLSWQPELIGTLIYVLRDNAQTGQREVLLIQKRSGHGQGLINGPGGKLEATETIHACARRELLEEVGIRAHNLKLQARIRFVDLDGPQWLGFVFITQAFTGTSRSSAEAIPAWHATHDLPWPKMWSSDALWLPQVLAGTQLEVNLLFDAGQLLTKQVIAST